MTIPIFIASSERFKDIEWLTPFSIRENTQSDTEIYIVRPEWYGMKESGCTGFTNVRWAIPQLCRELGYDFGIYLDVDMLVVGDIAELYGYAQRGKWVCLDDGSNEVSVICSTLRYPDKSVLHMRHKGTLPRGDLLPRIPSHWNVEDKITKEMRLLHFTCLKSQPWFNNHPNKEAVSLYESYRDRYRAKSDTGSDRVNRRVVAA